jgi:CRP-like cAMP-binding protein
LVKIFTNESNKLIKINIERIISNQIIQYFKSHFNFSKLTSKLTQFFIQKTYEVGNILISQGEIPNYVILLYYGQVKLTSKSKIEKNRFVEIGIYQPPTWFNEDCAIDNKASNFTITALTQLITFEVQINNFSIVADLNREINKYFMDSICRKKSILERRLSNYDNLILKENKKKNFTKNKIVNMNTMKEHFGKNLYMIYEENDLKFYHNVN